MQLRNGLTLLELIMVLMILVIIASISVPFTYRSFSGQRASKAADLVRSELNRARVQAMKTGEIHGFFYYPETQNFKVAPFNEEMVGILDQNRRDRNDVNYREFGGERLPKGVLFAVGEAEADSRSAAAEAENAAPSNVRPVLFYPDGSSQNARLYVRSDRDDFIEIRLRGMTGTSTTHPVTQGNFRRGANSR